MNIAISQNALDYRIKGLISEKFPGGEPPNPPVEGYIPTTSCFNFFISKLFKIYFSNSYEIALENVTKIISKCFRLQDIGVDF